MRWAVVVVTLSGVLPAGAQDFWRHWGDGRAEMNGYRLTQPRYGQPRSGTAVMVFVTEDFRDDLRVKAERPHPQRPVFPVMKLNAVRDFQTGIYDYNVMTSVFARVAAGWPLAKLSFSSQEWCGHVYHQLLPRAGRVDGIFHSYFEGEADGTEELPLPEGGIFEDALPILVRGWNGDWLRPGEARRVPLLPSLLRARLEHRPLAWVQATIARSATAEPVVTPMARLAAHTWTVALEGGPTLCYQVEAAAPYRLLRWASDAGEEAVLLGSTRLAYWMLNGPGGERYLSQMGLQASRR